MIWISRDLLREIEGEIGRCTRIMIDLSQQLASLVPLGDAPAVYSDPSYLALFDQGFPVRSVTRMSFFGMEVDVESEVVEVGRAPVDEARFTVPSTFQRYDGLNDFLELND